MLYYIMERLVVLVYQKGGPSGNILRKNPPSKKPELTNLQPKTLRNWTSLTDQCRCAFFWTSLFKPFWTSLEPYKRAPLQIPLCMSELDLTFKSKKLILGVRSNILNSK